MAAIRGAAPYQVRKAAVGVAGLVVVSMVLLVVVLLSLMLLLVVIDWCSSWTLRARDTLMSGQHG